MFAKTGGDLNTFGLRKPAPQVSPDNTSEFGGAQEARSEILMLYDRWSRTDTGGVVKSLKSAIGVFEEIDIVEHFSEVMGVHHTNLAYNENIRNRAKTQLIKRLNVYLDECDRAVASLETTLTHTKSLKERLGGKATVHASIISYIQGMIRGMEKILSVRKSACVRVKPIKSFPKEFEELQFILLILAETADDFIPETAARSVANTFPLSPRTLESVRARNGRDLFTSGLETDD
jgi:hypothetical protein